MRMKLKNFTIKTSNNTGEDRSLENEGLKGMGQEENKQQNDRSPSLSVIISKINELNSLTHKEEI